MHTGMVEQVFFLLPRLEYLWNPHRLYSVCIRISFLGYKVIVWSKCHYIACIW